MFKSLLKISTIILLISFCYVSVNYIGQTNAFFSDQATITNTLTAGVLDMTLRSGQSNFVPGADDMEPGDQVNRDIYVGKTAISLPLKHKVSFQFTSGDSDLCSQLDLKIWYDHYHGPVADGYVNRDMRLTYNGKLSNLANYTHTDFIIPQPDDWFDMDPTDGTEQWFYYSINLPSGTDISYQDKTCQFNFIFDAWQTNFPDSTQGFTDTEQISNTIASGHWETSTPPVSSGDVVINELMWMGSSGSTADEWIELRNITDSSIDLSNWDITEKSGGSEVLMLTIPSGKTIPANGYFLISNYDAAGSQINVTPDLIDASVELANTQLQTKLYNGPWDSGGSLIDTADDGIGDPAAGHNGAGTAGDPDKSMERNDVPGDGTLAADWHTCEASVGFDSGAPEKGTPGTVNLSDDPTLPNIDDQQDTIPLPQDGPEESQITEDGDNPDETTDEEAAEEDSDTENEGDPTTETEEESATEEFDDKILPTEEPTKPASEEAPADEEPTVDETTVEEEPSIVPEETTIVDGDVGIESDGDDGGGGDSDDTGDDGDGNGEADTE